MGKIGSAGFRFLAAISLIRGAIRPVCELLVGACFAMMRPARSLVDLIRSEYEGLTVGRTVWFRDR